MLRFHLVKDHQFIIHKNPNCPNLSMSMYGSQWITTKISTPIIQVDLSRKLNALVENQNGIGGQGSSNTLPQGLILRSPISTKIGFKYDHGSDGTNDFLRVSDFNGGATLAILQDAVNSLGQELKVTVEINKLRCIPWNRNRTPDAHVRTEEVDILELSKGPGVGGQEGVPLSIPDSWKAPTLEQVHDWQHWVTGAITIVCIVTTKEMLNSISEDGSTQRRYLRKMLDEGICSDATIVAGDGEEIKCHRFILIDRSDVFEAMFRSTSESKESITGTIQINDMCSKSVKAFLRFLYLGEIGEADEDSAIALDLLNAGHKYHVPKLEMRIKHLFLTKPDKWFNLEVAMYIYFFVKNLQEEGEALKWKVLGVMKWNHSCLKASPEYIRLFKEQPAAAMELTSDLIALQTTAGDS